MQGITGTDLLVERRAARTPSGKRVTQTDIAQALGIHKSNVSRLEDPDRIVSPERAQEYREALARCVAPAAQEVA